MAPNAPPTCEFESAPPPRRVAESDRPAKRRGGGQAAVCGPDWCGAEAVADRPRAGPDRQPP